MDWRGASPEERFAEAERRIDVSARTKATSLDLGDLGLAELPESLGQLQDLEELFLGAACPSRGEVWWDSERPRSSFPVLGPVIRLHRIRILFIGPNSGLSGNLQGFTQLEQLQQLSLYDCPGLTGDLLPLAQLQQLHQLSLSDCPGLTGDLLPLAQLQQLHQLSLYSCPGLTGDLQPIAQIQQLHLLSLSHCPGLTGDIQPLAKLPQLQNLDLFYCPGLIGELQPLAQLQQLQGLRLRYCQLTGGLESIIELPCLESLVVRGCESIEIDLEFALRFFNSSRSLEFVSCESIENIPAEVLSINDYDNCLPRLKTYLIDLEAGGAKDSEVKVILLGNGRVGKTQLCRRLRGETYDESSLSTHGIQLSRQPLTLRHQGHDSPHFLNWWDFGGQDIYHSTHSLFLRSRAIFLVLWTPLLENIDELEENGIPLRNQPLAYWLDYVRSLAGPDSPVIVIQSQCETFAQEQKPPLGPDLFTFSKICAFSARTEHGKEALETHLRDAIRFLKEKNGELLIGAGRAKLRDRLYAMRDAERSLEPEQRQHRTLSFEEFEKLCSEVGDISSPLHLLDYLHQTGVVFHQEGLFGGRIVLDQSWALDAVYSVFDRARTMPALRENGRFSRRDLAMLCWQDKSEKEQKLLLGLMESCGICFVYERDWRNEEHTYIAPDLLPSYEEVEKRLFAWRGPGEEEALRLEYRFLHSGLMRSIISKVGTQVREYAVYWKYGLWLCTRGGTQMMIRQDLRSTETQPGAGTLIIGAKGPEAVDLLRKIRKLVFDLPYLEKPKEFLKLGGATVDRTKLDAAIDRKVRTVDGRAADALPFLAFWDEKHDEDRKEIEKEDMKIDAAPLEQKPLRVFYSYAHEDESYRDQLAKFLKPLERDGLLQTWHDRAVEPGTEWDDEIRRKLAEADIVLLLVSVDFLASDYIWTKELKPALERHEQKLARVIPVILRTCDWHKAPFAKLLALPRDGKPIFSWADRDEAYTSVGKALRQLAEKRP